MKTIKWLGATGAVLALGAAGFISTSSSANGATVTATAGPGSHISCNISGAAKLSPALADDWTASQHTSDPSGTATFRDAIKSIPDHQFSAGTVPVTTSAKIATSSCTGSIVDATNPAITTGVTSAAVGTVSIGTGTDEATCAGLVTSTTGGTSYFDATIKWTSASTVKIAPTTIHALLSALTTSGVGFELKSGSSVADGDGHHLTSITGSFAGGTSDSKAYIDGITYGAFFNEIAQSVPTVDVPAVPGDPCQPTIQVKSAVATDLASDSISIKVKKPKGLKGITLDGDNSETKAPSDPTVPSTLVLNG